jgi:hypothetical protein
MKNFLKRIFKWNRFVAVNQFLDIDRKPHIIILTRDAVYEYDPTGKTKGLFTLIEAEKAKKVKHGN